VNPSSFDSRTPPPKIEELVDEKSVVRVLLFWVTRLLSARSIYLTMRASHDTIRRSHETL